MRISINWLKEMVATDVDPRGIAERLTLAGLAVDTIEEIGGDTLFEFDRADLTTGAVESLGSLRQEGFVHQTFGDDHRGHRVE